MAWRAKAFQLSLRLPLLLGTAASQANRVSIRSAGGGFAVASDGAALGANGTIRGAGGWGHVDAAQAYGADALRTWHITDLNDTVPLAEARGLRISAGIWLTHEASRYENCSDLGADAFWQAELASFLGAVRAHKNSSAILWWTVGNEMELEVDVLAGSDCLWRRLQWLVEAVKAEDPDHPVGTVLAGAHEQKVASIVRLCSSLDFLGVNTYGDSSLSVGADLLAAGWQKPYAIMEYGPTGHWEAPLTAWGSYIEETSTQKAPRYLATCTTCKEDPRCLGSFAFVWGWKWEKTGTWYGMFDEWEAVTTGVAVNCSNCESEVVAAVEHCWQAERQESDSPSIVAISVDGERLPGMRFSVDQSQAVPLQVEARHPDGRNLTALWVVTEEIVSDAIGGAFEATNPLLPGVWRGASGATAVGLSAALNTSGLPVGRSYRLYVFVREDPAAGGGSGRPHREATATLPFQICHTAVAGEECHDEVAHAMQAGGLLPSGPSSFEDFQMALHQQGASACAMPCGGLEEWCHTAVQGEECYQRVRRAMEEGIRTSPDAYPGLSNSSSFEQVQMALHRRGTGLCTRPCPAGSGAAEPPVSAGGRAGLAAGAALPLLLLGSALA